MKLALTLMTIILSTGTQAACKSMAKKAVSKKKVERSVTSSSYAKYSNVMKHYRVEITQDSEMKPKIISNSLYLKAGKVVGHEVMVDMGGDEDRVRYVLNAKRQIVVAYWYNQSPATYWFCGNEISEEAVETLEGEEI